MLFNHVEDIPTDLLQLSLHLLSVFLGQVHFGNIFCFSGFLLHARDDSPGGAPGSHDIFIRHREEISLLHVQPCVTFRHLLHGIDHLCRGGEERSSNASAILFYSTIFYFQILTVVSLCLLGQFGPVDTAFSIHDLLDLVCLRRGEKEFVRPRNNIHDPFPIYLHNS